MAKRSKGVVPTMTSDISSGSATATASHPSVAKPTQATTSARGSAPSYEQIAQRAREIWKKKGCLPGQDEQNWLEAERQLKAEFGGR